MKRIKLLYRFLILINTSFTFVLLIQLLILVIPDFVYSREYGIKILGRFNHLIILVHGLLLLVGLFKVQQGFRAILNLGFYNVSSENRFKKGGRFLILFGVFGAIYNLITASELELDVLVTNFIQYFFVVLVGLGLYILSEFIKNGGILKEENDLTI